MHTDRTVVITGVGPGLGSEVARVIARDGGNVVLAARSGDRLAEIADGLGAPDRVATCVADITSRGDCAAVAAAAVDRFGAVHGLVQVAAHEVMGGIGRTTDDDWHDVLTRNVVGTAHAVEAVTSAIGDDGGAVVLIGSQTQRVAATAGQQTAYAASKGALHSAMFHLAAEIASAMPLGEIPADDDIAEAVGFLCSDRARMITGQTLYVNGGNFMT